MDNTRLLIKVATMYYIDNMTQQEIASALGISRATVSRYLLQSKNEGLVRITINNPYSAEAMYIEEMNKYFPNTSFYVVDSSLYDNRAGLYQEMANEICDLLRPIVQNEIVLGVSAGETLGNICRYLQNINAPDLTVVPLLGGVYTNKPLWQANVIARNIADKFNANSYQLYAPFKALSEESRHMFVSEPANKAIFDIIDKCTVALVGIGTISSNPDVLLERLLNQDDLDDLITNDVVTNLCCSFLDRDGEAINTSFMKSLIGISHEKLKEIPLIIGTAIGKGKGQAVYSALKGSWLEAIVIDTELAKEIIRLCKEEQKK